MRGLPTRDEVRERFGRAALRHVLGCRCRWAERLVTGCCERHYRCHFRPGLPILEARQCGEHCPDYDEPEGETRPAGGVPEPAVRA
jgi:hypothetical protein